ncbi:unnamed protein product [Cyprideis torosa]|uniref:Uncharacterized protein n=1 Tax=Cyprideis torosa TaxID=163714 RepID=A0A7R8WGD2_9CRUS|nr:unnamed protein product [Cyprideis torosa]CAG0896484.1 unnamed protein product [Cyprideis torosa]
MKQALKSSEGEEDAFACVICLQSFREQRDYQAHFEQVHVEQNVVRSKLTRSVANAYFQTFGDDELLREAEEAPECSELNSELTPLQRLTESPQWSDEENADEEVARLMMKLEKQQENSLSPIQTPAPSPSPPRLSPVPETPHKFGCDYCMKSLTSRTALEAHLQGVHLNLRQFPCSSCPMVFKYKSNLLTHNKYQHSVNDTSACPICHKKLRGGSGNLMNHMKFVHGNEKPFTCYECSKAFSRSGDLKVHQKKHTDGKTFVCEVCDKKFKYQKSRLLHQRTSCPGLQAKELLKE